MHNCIYILQIWKPERIHNYEAFKVETELQFKVAMPTFATWASLDVCNAHLCNMSKFGCFQCPPLPHEHLWMFPMPTFAIWAPLDVSNAHLCNMSTFGCMYNMYLKISLNYLYTALPPLTAPGGWMAMMCNENLANLLSQPNLNQLILTGGSYYSPGRSVEQGGHLPHGDYLPEMTSAL